MKPPFGVNVPTAEGQAEDDVEVVPAPSIAEVDACRVARWRAVPSLDASAFRATTIPLPSEFVDYLLEDGLSLPAGSEAMPARVDPDVGERLESAFSRSDEEEEEEEDHDDDVSPKRSDIKSKLMQLRELRKDVRKNLTLSKDMMNTKITTTMELPPTKETPPTSHHHPDTAVGAGRNAVTTLQARRKLDSEHPSNVPTPRRNEENRSVLLNKNQLTTQSTFTRIEDLMIRQEQMWSELISLQRLVYDPPWLPSLEARLEKLETQMEEAIMRIDAVERKQKEIDNSSKQQARLTNWTLRTASSMVLNDDDAKRTNQSKMKKSKNKISGRHMNEVLSNEILRTKDENSKGKAMLKILSRKHSKLSELTPKACAVVLGYCADLITKNKFLDDAIPWIEEAISLQLIPPLLQIPLRERIIDSLYKLSSSPTNYGVKAAELYQKSSRLGWVSAVQ